MACRHHDIEDRARVCPSRAVLAQAAKDILDVDHRIVDQFADGDREPAQRHSVDRQAHEPEHDRRREDRDGVSRSARSQWFARLERNANSTTATTAMASASTFLHIGDRGFDEGGLPEQDVVDLNAAPERLRDVGKGGLDLPVNVMVSTSGCSRPTGSLRPAHVAGLAALQPRAVSNLRDLMQLNGRPWTVATVTEPRSSSLIVRPMLRIRTPANTGR